jgi:hypothetical protein
MIARDYVPWEVVLLTSRLIFVGDLTDWLVFIVCVGHINSIESKMCLIRFKVRWWFKQTNA